MRPVPIVLLLSLLPLGAPGCATLADRERVATGYSGIVLSNFKFPILWRSAAAGYGSPLSPEQYAALKLMRPFDCPDESGLADEAGIDRFAEFGCADGSEDTLVVVALSGGGSRAGLMAAYALDLLERKYVEVCAKQNQRVPGSCPEGSFARTIDAFSTVSGGSIYAYYLLREAQADAGRSSADLFRRARANRADGLRNLGRWVFWSYFGGSLFGRPIAGLWPVSWIRDVFTDLTYRDYLIRGLEFGGFPRAFGFVPSSPSVRFHDVAEWTVREGLPRFYFNATSVRSASPFVLTQRITNLRPPSLPSRGARLDLPLPECSSGRSGGPECDRARLRPLRHSVTLEDVGNSPAGMGVAIAAVASAAFPFAVDPVTLRRYDWADPRVEETDQLIRLADGGAYDNSGITTAADLYEYLQLFRHVEHLVLIAVNADAERYDEDLVEPATVTHGAPSRFRIGVPWPTLASGPDAINLIHYTNKRRAEQMAWRQIESVTQRIYDSQPAEECPTDPAGATSPGVSSLDSRVRRAARWVHYFPVDLSQLAPRDPEHFSGGEEYYRRAARLATTFWTRDDDSDVLTKATQKILSTEQKSWRVGACGSEISRLDEAVAYSVIRASSPKWDALDHQGCEVAR